MSNEGTSPIPLIGQKFYGIKPPENNYQQSFIQRQKAPRLKYIYQLVEIIEDAPVTREELQQIMDANETKGHLSGDAFELCLRILKCGVKL